MPIARYIKLFLERYIIFYTLFVCINDIQRAAGWKGNRRFRNNYKLPVLKTSKSIETIVITVTFTKLC